MSSWYGNMWNGATDLFDGLGSFGADIYRAGGELVEGDIGGAADLIVGSAQEDLLGTSLMGLFGPQGVVGTAIGAIPEPIRQPAKSVINPVFGVINFGLEEIVDRPLGTGATILNLAVTKPSALFDLSTYARAYAINDERTVGQSVMTLAYLSDPFNEEEFDQLQDKPIFNLFSGAMDFAAEFLDPTIYAGMFAVKAARGAAVVGNLSKTGQISSRYGRTFSNARHLSSGKRLAAAPDINFVRGRGMGVRRADIAGRRIRGLTATDQQIARRQKVADLFTDERSANFVKNDQFVRMNNAVQEGTSAAERAAIATLHMGKAAKTFGRENILKWATGETAAARELSMRVMMGDSTAHLDAMNVAKEIQRMHNSSDWAAISQYRTTSFRRGKTDMTADPVTGDLTPVDPRIQNLSKQYDDLVSQVDWNLLDKTNDALKSALPKSMAIDPNTGLYKVKDVAEATLNSVDNGIAVQAIEDLVGKYDPSARYANSVFLQTGEVRNLPYGVRISKIFEEQTNFLNRTKKKSAITTYVDPDTFLGQSKVVRFISEKVNRARIYFHDSGSTVAVQRTMRDASRIVLPNGKKFITDDRARNIVQRYEQLRSQGNIAQAQDLFLTEVRKINEELDNYLAQFHLDNGFAYERHIADEWELAQREVTSGNKRETVISLQDDNGKVVGSAVATTGTNGETILANVRVSPRQLERSAALPRYDIVQKNIELIAKRASSSRRVRVSTKTGDVFRLGVRKGGDVTNVPMKYWRSGVLLTPKWPMRITLEEQLRMATQLGTLATSLNFYKGVGELRRSYAIHNFSNADILADHNLLEQAVRDAAGSSGETKSLLELMDDIGVDGFQKIVKGLVKEKVMTRRALRRSKINSSLKAVGVAALFTNPFVGGLYGFVSFGRKTRRMMQQQQRTAALHMSAALRARARQMILKSPDDQIAYAAAMDIMSEADYLAKLAAPGQYRQNGRFAKRPISQGEAQQALNSFELADDLLDEAGFGKLQIGGQAFRAGFGDDPRFMAQIQREVSANQHAGTLLRGHKENVARDLAESAKADFKISDVLEMSGDEFADAWGVMLNRMSSASANNEFFQIVWSNEDVGVRLDKLVDLLNNNPEVFHSVISDVHPAFVADDMDLIAEYILTEYDNILPPGSFDGFRDLVRSGEEVRWQDVQDFITSSNGSISFNDAIDLYRNEGYEHFGKALHPEVVELPTQMGLKVDKYIENFYEMFGTLPSDELSRFPFYKATYDVELRRLTYRMLDDDGTLTISQNQMNNLERQAREYSLQQTRDVLFELAETSRLGEFMGNASPFFSAYMEVIGRWAGFTADNPFFIAKVGHLYKQPWEAKTLGLQQVTVETNAGGEATYIVFKPSGDAWDEEGNPTTIFEAMPESIRDLFIPAAMRDSDAPLRFSKDGFNTLMQGSPGFGPLVTVPAREVLNTKPELEPTLKFMFPFGHPHGDFFTRTRSALLPAWSNNVENLLRQTHTRETVVNRMFRDLTIQMADAGDPLDWNDEVHVMEVLEEAERRTENFFMFRVFAGLFSPTSTTVLSPYDGLVQQYRELENNLGFEEAQEQFLTLYGSDFFALTGRMSQLNDGVASTWESEELYMANQKLVQAHPEIGAWITGSVGTVDEETVFSQITYNKQFIDPVSPGSQTTRREIKTPQQYVEDTQVQQGWREYSDLMSEIRGYQDRAAAVGLSTGLTSNHMRKVKALKDAAVEEITARFPAWRKEFDDFGSSTARLVAVYDGFAAALQVEEIVQRPSSKHVMEFLQFRIELQKLLDDRAAAGYTNNIQASENSDIAMVWESGKEEFGMRPDFETIYDRYFARDKLLPQTFISEDDFPMLKLMVKY